jgi:hypothetical protein
VSNKRLVLAGLLLLLMVGAFLWSSNLYGRQSKAKDLGDAVEVVESKAVEGAMRITLRNTSSKNINALQIAVGGSGFLLSFWTPTSRNRNYLLKVCIRSGFRSQVPLKLRFLF